MSSPLRFAVALAVAFLSTGCPAVFPEISTRMRNAPPGKTLDPPPPNDLKWIKFVSAKVPEKTRDGRPWGQAFGKLADPYAKLIVNEKELLKTPVQSQTLAPTWPNGPKGNYKLAPGDRLRIELWDANPLNDAPVGIRELGRLSEEMLEQREIRVDLDTGGEVTLLIEPAHATWGLGLWLELRTSSAYVTRMLQGSPAERAGLKPGDEILRIGPRDVKSMTGDEVRSFFNAVPPEGLALVVKHEGAGGQLNVTLKEGPVYPSVEQFKFEAE